MSTHPLSWPMRYSSTLHVHATVSETDACCNFIEYIWRTMESFQCLIGHHFVGRHNDAIGCINQCKRFCQDFQLVNLIAHFRDDDDDDEDEAAKGTAAITSFFTPKNDSVDRQRHQFFQERHLEPVDSF